MISIRQLGLSQSNLDSLYTMKNVTTLVDYKSSEKTERRFVVILAPLSSKECSRKDKFIQKVNV